LGVWSSQDSFMWHAGLVVELVDIALLSKRVNLFVTVGVLDS
jgi:hypothetical protein